MNTHRVTHRVTRMLKSDGFSLNRGKNEFLKQKILEREKLSV